MTEPLKLAIAGLGTVGAGIVKIVQTHGDLLAARAGRPIEITAISARSRSRDRGVDLSAYAWEDRETYKSRRDVLVESMGRAGFDIPPPPATMFAWAPVPEPFRELGSMAFSKILLQEADVAVSPGIGFGEYGEGYVRLGLVENEQRIRQAARNVRGVMDNAADLVARYKENPDG